MKLNSKQMITVSKDKQHNKINHLNMHACKAKESSDWRSAEVILIQKWHMTMMDEVNA